MRSTAIPHWRVKRADAAKRTKLGLDAQTHYSSKDLSAVMGKGGKFICIQSFKTCIVTTTSTPAAMVQTRRRQDIMAKKDRSNIQILYQALILYQGTCIILRSWMTQMLVITVLRCKHYHEHSPHHDTNIRHFISYCLTEKQPAANATE